MIAKEKGDRPIDVYSDCPKAHTKFSPSHCISNQSKSLYKAHLKDLKASGLTDENIAKIQHFSADVETARALVGYELSGLIFSYFDPCGIPYHCVDGTPFYRIKPDWGDRKTEDSPKYLSPKDQGCRPYFSCLYSDWPKVIKSTKIDLWETEGEKKGDSGCANGLAAIAFAGVDAWVDSCDRITGDRLSESRVLPELDAIEWKHRKVYQCFDSDIIEKIPVQTALAKRAYYLRQLGAYPYLVLLPNEINGAKNGLDDFVFRHGIEALRILGKEAKPTPLELPKTKQGKDAGAVLKLEEPNEQYKSLMAWAVLKEDWAYRAGIGWYQWQGNHWKLKPTEEFEAVLNQFMDAQNWHKRSSGIMTSIIRLLRSRLLVKEEEWNPFGKLAFQNGTLDVISSEFTLAHNPSDRFTQFRPYNFDPTADCLTWLRFIHEAMEGDTDRVELIRAMFRYAVMPRSRNKKADIEKSFDLYGRKGTGKGTVLDVLTHLVGSDNVASISVATFKDPTSLGQLLDKDVAIDYDASGFLRNVGVYNKVVSNEPVEVKKLYRDTCTVRLGVVVVRAYNEFLGVPEGSEGLDRRLIVVPFNHKPKVVDSNLSQKLETELPGIFAWCYSMAHDEMKKRILKAGEIKAIAQISHERFEANNPEFLFLIETFPQGKEIIKAGVLYASYLEWCRGNNQQHKSNVKFASAIQSLRCKRSSGKINGCYYYSIPDMRNFEVSDYLGIVEGGFRDSHRDTSNSSTESDRDSCRPLNCKSFNANEKEQYGIDQGENRLNTKDLSSQLSTTISNSLLERNSTVSTPSSTVSSVSWKVGDRVKARIEESWKEAVLMQLPSHHSDLDKRTSFWQVKVGAEKEYYIWSADEIQPLDTP